MKILLAVMERTFGRCPKCRAVQVRKCGCQLHSARAVVMGKVLERQFDTKAEAVAYLRAILDAIPESQYEIGEYIG